MQKKYITIIGAVAGARAQGARLMADMMSGNRFNIGREL